MTRIVATDRGTLQLGRHRGGGGQRLSLQLQHRPVRIMAKEEGQGQWMGNPCDETKGIPVKATEKDPS